MSGSLLSVCLITYNHINYIRDAIEGVLMQKVDFLWELIIADDLSTDGTREIVQEYQQKYPEFIRLILQKENVGAKKNWYELISVPKSKYIAYFEGDDYWTDPYKLQKQVDFLESNPEYSIVCHNYDTLNMHDGKISNLSLIYNNDLLNSENYIINLSNWADPYILKTCTIVFRKIWLDLLLFNRYKYFRDVHLWTMLLKNGPGMFFHEKMAVYRISESGINSLQPIKNKAITSARIGYELNSLFNKNDFHIYNFAKNNIENALNIYKADRKFSDLFVIWELLIKNFMLRYNGFSFYKNFHPLKLIALFKKLVQSLI